MKYSVILFIGTLASYAQAGVIPSHISGTSTNIQFLQPPTSENHTHSLFLQPPTSANSTNSTSGLFLKGPSPPSIVARCSCWHSFLWKCPDDKKPKDDEPEPDPDFGCELTKTCPYPGCLVDETCPDDA